MGSKSTKSNQPVMHNTTYITHPARSTQTQTQSLNHKLFKDRFTSFSDLEKGLRDAGLESSNLIIGIDFTRSNEWNGGGVYFPDKHLHSLAYQPNLYQQVITIMGKTLEPFDDDKLIPAYGFGDMTTTDKTVFPFIVDPQTGFEVPCHTFAHILQVYNKIAVDISTGVFKLSGPTTFAPLIHKAIDIVKANRSYHILLIITDGVVDNKQETIDAIVAASNFPMSIICIGVGKHDFKDMQEFDDEIPKRRFDNFQFVDFYKTMKDCENVEAEFAKRALMEIPDQYNYIRKNLL